MDQKKSLNAIDNLLLTLWGIGIFSAIMIVFSILRIGFHDAKMIAPLIGAFAIFISAGIASASVMKSIYTTKINDQEKAEKEKERKRIFAFNVMETIHLTVESLNDSTDIKFVVVAHLDFKENMETVNKLIESTFSESILPFLSDDEQKRISIFYSSFIKFLFIKQLSHPDIENDKDIEEFFKLMKSYKKQFTKFSKEYIEEYKIQKNHNCASRIT